MPDSDNDSDFAEYGTSLEPIEDDELKRKKPITVAEQIAVDERGRRRFHGAFTGGFSAGYFNTVGSKEGWTPSTFRSSRGDKSSFKTQNVLDYMDDEDKGAFGIAPQILRPTEDFTNKTESRGRKRPIQTEIDNLIPGMPVLDQILQPARETVGIKILIKMGWRPGRGVGPKIQKTVKKPRIELPEKITEFTDKDQYNQNNSDESGKVYGCRLPPELFKHGGSSSESDDEGVIGAEELLAPDDVYELICNPKENNFGLGYKGLDRNTLTTASDIDLFGGTKLKFRVENKHLSITGQAFGVGAFEDNDEDIYCREDMSQYDFALETPDERKQRKTKEKQDQRKTKNKENCIEGFKISTVAKLHRKIFPAPKLPLNFEPFHAIKKSRFEVAPPTSQPVADGKQDAIAKGLGRHSLEISERQILIEDDINKFETKAKLRCQNITLSDESLETEDVETSPTPKPKIDVKDIQHRMERLQKFTQVLQAYSSNKPDENKNASFKPFMKNPEKQERYEKYLTLRDAGFKECLRDLQPVEMAEWERDREKMEFERASKLYKPMSSILSSRFTSAKSHDISHLDPEKEIITENDPKDDPKVAAKMRLFGKLTHKVTEWHPDKLVCKRFNIPHPYPESKFVGLKDPTRREHKPVQLITESLASTSNMTMSKPVVKKSLFDNLDFSKPPPGLLPPESSLCFKETPMESSADSEATSLVTKPRLAFEKELLSSSRNDNTAASESSEIITRPPLDLFKEIFADSSDDDDNDDNDKREIENQQSQQHSKPNKISDKKSGTATGDDKVSDKIVAPSSNGRESLVLEKGNVNQRDKILGPSKRGIFDKIDLDRFQDRVSSLTKESNNDESSDMLLWKNNEVGDIEVDTYGPQLPKSAPICRKSINASSEDLQKPSFIPRSSSNAAASTSSTLPVSSTLMNYRHQSKSYDERKKDSSTEEAIWVEKSALSSNVGDRNSRSNHHGKSKKHHRSSSKKSHKKSSKIERNKSHKSSEIRKHKKGKHKSKREKHHRHRKSKSGSGTESGSDEDSSDSSDSSITINKSLDNSALLAKLKQITKSK